MKRLISFLVALCLPIQTLAACTCIDSIPLHVEITAAYPQPLENEEEWVELSNTGDIEIDLSYYTLEDSTSQAMNLEGEILPGESSKITDLSFQLNNSGDSLTLYTVTDELVHSFSYETSAEAQIVSAATEENAAEETEDQAEEESSSISQWPEYSEAVPNPEGSDSTDEWIELYNPYDTSLELDGLQLDDQDGGSSPYSLSGSMDAASYLLISVEDSGINLNNSTDEIRLLLGDEILWSVPYSDVQEGMSYALVNGSYQWTTPTPGTANLSDNIDGQLSEDIEITEINPNPEGADADNEWIEITNGGEQSVDLGNWSIDDSEGGSDPYIIPDGTIIAPGESLIIERTVSEIALNNSRDKVQLFDFTDELIDEIEYESTQEGRSYSKIEIEEVQNLQASSTPLGLRSRIVWEWTEPSPGENNPIWKEFVATVQSFDAGILTLLHQNSELIFDVLGNEFGELIFQPGNTVMIQASMSEITNELIRAELLEQVIIPDARQIPWSWLLMGIMASGLIIFEWHKYNMKNHIITPHSKLLKTSS